jgi:hypothetical protein
VSSPVQGEGVHVDDGRVPATAVARSRTTRVLPDPGPSTRRRPTLENKRQGRGILDTLTPGGSPGRMRAPVSTEEEFKHP